MKEKEILKLTTIPYLQVGFSKKKKELVKNYDDEGNLVSTSTIESKQASVGNWIGLLFFFIPWLLITICKIFVNTCILAVNLIIFIIKYVMKLISENKTRKEENN